MAAEGEGAKDPRDKVGKNPTGRPTKSSAGKRRQEARKAVAKKDEKKGKK
jgi:hypothetical protein